MYTIPATVAAVLAQLGNPLGIPKEHLSLPPVGNVVVATVNGSPIKAMDVEHLLWQWRGEEAIQELVSAMLVAQDAKKRGVTVTDAEVQTALKAQLQAMGNQVGAGGNLESSLRQDGFTTSRLYLRKRAELLVDKILAKDFDPAGYVKISTIIFRPQSAQVDALSEAIGNAKRAYDKLLAGATWEAVLREHHTEDRILRTNGLLGWRELKAFPESTRAELATLKVGGFTKPVQTANGIQIFRLEALGKNASEPDKKELRATYMDAARQQYVQRIRSTAKIQRHWPPTNG